jgi:hypothetical protein
MSSARMKTRFGRLPASPAADEREDERARQARVRTAW